MRQQIAQFKPHGERAEVFHDGFGVGSANRRRWFDAQSQLMIAPDANGLVRLQECNGFLRVPAALDQVTQDDGSLDPLLPQARER